MPPDARRREPLHPADALFLAIDTPEVPQQIGAVVVVEPGGRGPLTEQDVADLARGLPRLRGRLDRGGLLRRAAWLPDPSIDPADLVDSVDLRPAPSHDEGDDGDDDGTVENEICPVFSARLASPPEPNPDEIDGLEWVAMADVARMIDDEPERLSPWMREQFALFPAHPLSPR